MPKPDAIGTVSNSALAFAKRAPLLQQNSGAHVQFRIQLYKTED